MEIRFTNINENQGVRDLWTYCFADSQAYVDFYFKNKYKPEKTMVVEDGGRILSSIHLNQHRLNLSGKDLATSYIVGVSTLPEARGMGFMADLMSRSLYEIGAMDQSFAILMPIDHRLYRSYGFETCYDILEVKLDIFDLKKFKLDGNFKRAGKEEAGDLLDVYSSAIAGYNGSALRDQAYFSEFIEEMDIDGGYTYIFYRDGQPTAYLAYTIEGGNFFVREVYYKDMGAYQSVLKFIFNHNTQCKVVTINTGLDDRLMDILDNPKDASFTLKPFMMARITDLEKFLVDLEIKSGLGEEASLNHEDTNLQGSHSANIEVSDPVIRENNGIYRFDNKSGILRAKKHGNAVSDLYGLAENTILGEERGSLEKLVEDQPEIDISLTINELASLLFGYRTIEDICFIKGMEASDSLKAIFDFKKKTNHINEYV